jgi:hypothetical protein
MPRVKRIDRLTVSGLTEADQQWLAAESERLGIDPENIVRAMIRARRSLHLVEDVPPVDGAALRSSYEEQLDPAPIFRSAAQDLPEQNGTFPDDDASLADVMRAPPSIVGRPAEPRASPWNASGRAAGRYQPARAALPARSSVAATPAPNVGGGAFAAFTLVQPVGLSDRVVRGPMQGDGLGNVLRQNNTWLGFSNGSRRG